MSLCRIHKLFKSVSICEICLNVGTLCSAIFASLDCGSIPVFGFKPVKAVAMLHKV
jgi:hypothetical protein